MTRTKEAVDPNRWHYSFQGDGESVLMERQRLEINRGHADNRQKSHRSTPQGPLQQKLVLYYSSDSGAKK